MDAKRLVFLFFLICRFSKNRSDLPNSDDWNYHDKGNCQIRVKRNKGLEIATNLGLNSYYEFFKSD